MDRRTFLKMAGMGSISFAAGCTAETEKALYALVHAPENMVTGAATWYATTCRECPAGCGVIAKNREGRVIKLEGNPLHPVNRGALCARGQAAVQRQYHPDRLSTPLAKTAQGTWEAVSFEQALSRVQELGAAAGRKGSDRIGMLTELVGDRLMGLFTTTLAQWNAGPPLIFETFGYDTLKSANQRIFGQTALPAYRFSDADVLIAFGADFLETWLSPVEYSRQFKEMHAARPDRETAFIHVSPHQSLTAANADLWIPCRPGGEAFVALGLMRAGIEQGRIRFPQAGLTEKIRSEVAGFTPRRVENAAGVTGAHFQALIRRVESSQRPVFLPTGACSHHANALQADMAAALLNLAVDPQGRRMDFHHRHRMEKTTERDQILRFFQNTEGDMQLLLLNNVNPAFALPASAGVAELLKHKSLYVVAFSNFMDETAMLADLVIPTRMPLESWGEYGGQTNRTGLLQPVTAPLYRALDLTEIFFHLQGKTQNETDLSRRRLYEYLRKENLLDGEANFVAALQQGGVFNLSPETKRPLPVATQLSKQLAILSAPTPPKTGDPILLAAPSHRFFDGRGANLPWLCELPEPLTQVAWQSPLLVHPDAMAREELKNGDIVEVKSPDGSLEAPVYSKPGLHPDTLLMYIGQGHTGYGRYAKNQGANPLRLMPGKPGGLGAGFAANPVDLKKTGRRVDMARMDGSSSQYGRKIAMTLPWRELSTPTTEKSGLTMHNFPLTLPIPEGYDKHRDFYPPHDHDGYRWAMTVDLDRCIACGACTTACYAENNIGVVGEQQVVQGREMTWLRIDRYLEDQDATRVQFLPMMCQHCDNAPCESVCPVYAPHHGKEGMNNQIYNRCIGTRFCSQNCPYKVRRFNWYAWPLPEPLSQQLNPNVTVRAKGVMEKCSFCIQRIKEAHGVAKNENRRIRDGEAVPACVQTCPTGALTFGDLMDPASRVRQLAENRRAYQVMGYLNTKPAVIYLRKVLREV